MQSFAGKLWVGVLWGCAWLASVQAQPLSAEERLEAIRNSLVQAVTQGPIEVRSTQWIDRSGQLRESASFKTGMEVRGMRVLAYGRNLQDEPNAQLQMDAKALPARAACRYPVTDGLHAWHHMTLEVTRAPQMSAGQIFQTQQLEQSLRAALRSASQRTRLWAMSERQPRKNTYEQTLTGRGEQYIPLHLRMHFATTVDNYTGATTYRVQWTLFDQLAQTTVLSTEHKLTLELSDPQLEPRALSSVVMEQVQGVVLLFARDLEAKLACVPPKFQVLHAQAKQLRIAGGLSSGLKVGDQMVVTNLQYIPSRIFEPKAMEKLALAEVTAVTGYYAELKQIAGPALTDAVHYVAIPHTP